MAAPAATCRRIGFGDGRSLSVAGRDRSWECPRPDRSSKPGGFRRSRLPHCRSSGQWLACRHRKDGSSYGASAQGSWLPGCLETRWFRPHAPRGSKPGAILRGHGLQRRSSTTQHHGAGTVFARIDPSASKVQIDVRGWSVFGAWLAWQMVCIGYTERAPIAAGRRRKRLRKVFPKLTRRGHAHKPRARHIRSFWESLKKPQNLPFTGVRRGCIRAKHGPQSQRRGQPHS